MSDCLAEQDKLSELAGKLSADLQQRMNTIVERYQPEMDSIKDDAPNTEGVDASIGFDFDVKWENVSMKFDLPEITMKLQTWSLDLPQVTMKDKRIVFHTPSVRMVNKKVGQYPEVHGFSVRWKDIIISVPETFMQEHQIIMGIPEFRMDRTEFKLDVPEVAMRTQEIVLKLPQFTLKDIKVEAGRMENRFQDVSNRMDADIASERNNVTNSAREQLVGQTNTLFTCMRTQIQNKRTQTAAMFDGPISMFQQSLSKLDGIDSNETRGQAAALRQQLAVLTTQRTDADTQFEKAINKLVEDERTTVEQLVSRLAA